MQIKMVGNVPAVSTLDVYEGLGVEHETIMRLIKKHKSHFDEIRIVRFEIRKIKKGRGRSTTFCYLDEEQATFLITLMKNSEKVVEFKKRLTRGFYRMKKFIAVQMNQRANAEWLEARKNGKVIRRQETDTIRDFVEYATAQGSKNARMYYVAVSRMQNKALFFLDQKYPNIRELLDVHQLATVSVADRVVARAIKKGMEQALPYKDIYQLAKSNVETLAAVHGKTPVPAMQIDNHRQTSLLET